MQGGLKRFGHSVGIENYRALLFSMQGGLYKFGHSVGIENYGTLPFSMQGFIEVWPFCRH